ncbi:MAG TPA: Calx-beta domain-containing protein [Pyrinomonadaceae bacterium]|nr:Calx-beta domain-containing protein [Pyrinomonadaceae bacterium]
MKTRLFAASAFLLVAAFFSFAVSAANPNQSTLATSSANTQQAGFVASTISDLLSLLGLTEVQSAQNANGAEPAPTPPVYDDEGNVKNDVGDVDLLMLEAVGSFSGDTTGGPTFSRPNANGTLPPTTTATGAFFYRANQITVDATGLYTITSNTGTYDGFICLYQGTFNPATPLVNALECNDDFGNTRTSQITENLVAGTNYFIVNTSFLPIGTPNAIVAGPFTTNVVGPGNITGVGVAACAVPAGGMTAWFAANGNTLDTAPNDLVADVATLTNGATFGPGRVGQGFLLDGTNDYVAVTPSVDTDINTSNGVANNTISMAAWINPGTINPVAVGQPIAEYGTPTETGVHFWHSVGTPGNLFVNLVDTAGGNHTYTSVGAPVTAGTLQHVAFSFDGTTLTFYHNGVAFPATNIGGNPAPDTLDTNDPLNIGARLDGSPGPAVFYQGIIDEFQLFNSAITAADVGAIANAGVSGTCAGTVQFSTAAQTTPEGNVPPTPPDGPGVVITVTRTGDTSGPATVQVFTTSGTAIGTDGTGCTVGFDYLGFSAANPRTVAFAAGQTTATTTIGICDDAVVEPTESFTVHLGATTGTGSIGTPAVQTITITDAADTPVSVTVAPLSVTEDGAGNLVFTFSRPDAGAGAITVPFTISGSAIPGTDYICSAGTGATAASCVGTVGSVTFLAGATTAQVIADPTVDTDFTEGNETVTFTVGAGTASVVGAPSSATGTITEDDTNVIVTVAPGTVNENGVTNLVYTFTRTGALTAGQVVTFSVGGTACGASVAPAAPVGQCNDNFPPDYTVSGATSFTGTNGTVPGTGTVTFVGNATTATVTVDPTADANVELSETVILTVTNTPGITGAPSSAIGTIANDDTVYTIAATPPAANEGNVNNLANLPQSPSMGGSIATFTVTRTGDLSQPGTISVATDPLDNRLNRAIPGQQNTNCGLVNGVDYITDGITLTFPVPTTPVPPAPFPTTQTMTFTVVVCGDTDFEANEVFDAFLFNPVGGTLGVPSRATYTILNDDAAPVLNISDGQAVEGNAITFTVSQVNQAGAAGTPLATGVDTTFSFCTTDITATAGVDYTGQPCPGGLLIPITIPAGQTSVTFTVPTSADLIFEGNETFLVNLIGVTNATVGDGQGVGTITDAQQPNVFTVSDVAQAEGSVVGATTSFNFTVTRSSDAQGTQVVCYDTVPGTTIPPGNANPATPGTAPGTPPNADYTDLDPSPANCLTFVQGGPASQTLSVIVYHDTMFEPDESFTVRLISITGAQGDISDTGLGTIINDDNAPVLAFGAAAKVTETDTGTTTLLTFTVNRTAGAQVTSTVDFVVAGANLGTTAASNTIPATGGTTCVNADTTGTDFIIPTPTAPATANRLTFAPGVDQLTFSVVVCGDVRDEASETVRVTLSNPSLSTIAATTLGGTINDNDGPFIFTVSDVTLAEGNSGTTCFNFVIRRTGSHERAQTVTVSTVDGTATVADNDYVPVVGRVLNFPANPTGDPALNVIETCVLMPRAVDVNGDLQNETDERFTLQIDNITTVGINAGTGSDDTIASLNPLFGGDGQGLGTILNDDGPRTFAIDNVTANEGSDPANPVVFRFRVTGTGTSAIDQTFTFTVQDSNTPQSGLDATGGTICGGINSSSPDFTTPFAATGGSTGTLTFFAGSDQDPTMAGVQNFRDILVPICADTVQEANERFTVTIASTVPGTIPTVGSVGTGTIVNDDAISFRVDDVTGQEGNDPNVPTNFVFRINRIGATTLSSSVNFVIENAATGVAATGGAACGPGIDYISAPLTTGVFSASPAAFTAGETFREIAIRVCGDLLQETDETFQLRLTGGTNAAFLTGDPTTDNIGLGTIINDDGIPGPQGIEGDINRAVAGVCGPGDGQHTAADSAQFKRFIAGLDTPCTGSGLPGTFNEFQRTDTAPEGTLGDGRLTAADQQQIDNYIANLDPDRPAGGPTAPIPGAQIAERSSDKSEEKGDDDAVIETGGGREFRGVLVSGAPDTFVDYAVELVSQGDETVTTFSLQFDRTRLSLAAVSGTNVNAGVVTAGSGVSPATSVTVNATQVTGTGAPAGTGQVGVLLDFQGPVTAGVRQVAVFRFRILPTAPAGLTPVTFVDQPIVRSTSNAQAQALTAKYTPNNVNVVIGPGGPGRTVTIVKTTAANGGQAIVPIVLASQGNETGISGSVSFAVGSLTISNVSGTGTNPDVLAGSGLPAGCTITTNGTEVAQGRLGFLIACPTAFTAGNREVIRLRFGVPAGAPVPRSVPITWVNTPVAQGVTDAAAVALTTTFVNGAVNIDIGTAARGAISGLVTDANGMGIRNAIITISGVGLAEPVQVTTSSLGYFNVEGLDIGETYLVSLRASKRYQFSNATRLVTLTDSAQAVNFTAEQ